MNNRNGWLVVFVFSLVAFLGLAGNMMVRSTQFDWYCGGYLDRAAHASNARISLENLDRALSYVERRGWTRGHTSLVFNTTDEDIGAWYRNLQGARAELQHIGPRTPQFEESNVLMRVRETLGDNSVKYPSGITMMPHPVARLLTLFAAMLLTVISAFMKWFRH